MEWIAAAVSLLGIWFNAKRVVWNWGVSIVASILYAIVFYHSKLYADCGLQFVFVSLSVFGWFEWNKSAEVSTTHNVQIRYISIRLALALFALWLSGSAALYWVLSTYTDAQVPLVDSALTVASMCAQYVSSKRYIENWLMWIVIDACYVALFYNRALYPTAILYGVFTIVAWLGYKEWRGTLETSTG